MKTINQSELKALLTFRGCRPVTILAETFPKMIKTGSPFRSSTVSKIARVNGMANWAYENAVNNQRFREQGEDVELFRAFPRKWGVRIQETPFVEHKGVFYLELKIQKVLGREFRVDGIPTPDEAVKCWIAKPSKASIEKQRAHQGVEKMIELRDYKLSGIREISINNDHYAVV